MAQPMMHLLIADKIYTEKSSSIYSYSDFLLGSIAPDAVHVKENYTRGMKDISHYKFNSKSRTSYFDTFFEEYHTSENKDFVVGYLVHLLSDMVWYHSVRMPFKEEFLRRPSYPNMSMNEAYYADCRQMEQLMYFEKNTPRIMEAINKSKAYTLEGLIDSESVEAWKKQLIFSYNNRGNTLFHTQYISEQHIRGYITNCVKVCTEYFSRFPYF